MPPPSKDASLSQRLADALPESSTFTFYHISTPPTKCPAVFAAPQGARPERTYRESHFLSVSIRPGGGDGAGEVLVLAIEVLIYTTANLTTVFVSKADSTGYLSLLSIPRGHISPLRAIATTFISYLVQHRQRPKVRLVVSLFARASDQYLFPGSVQNSAKHVSDDRQLIKWWCRVLDPVLRDFAAEEEEEEEQPVPSEGKGETTSQAYLIVPGEEGILSFLPPDVRLNPPLRKRWKHCHPLRQLSSTPTAPPRCLIPHFPDDPKARFLNELDDEIPDSTGNVTESPSKRGTGQWKSVKSLEQFWEMMAFRQECSSGRLVGFIWVVFTPPDLDAPTTADSQPDSQGSLLSPPCTFPLPDGSSSNLEAPPSAPQARKQTRKPSHQRRKLTGPIVPRMPRIKSASSTLSTISLPTQSPHYIWPAESRGEVVLDEKKYSKATETLLRLDFADQQLAADSTRTWIDEVAVLVGLSGPWGRQVGGRKKLPAPATGSERISGGATMLQVKKRKVEVKEGKENGGDGVCTLAAGLVRKKAKVQPEPVAAPPVGNGGGINLMSGGLVRKKPKAV